MYSLEQFAPFCFVILFLKRNRKKRKGGNTFMVNQNSDLQTYCDRSYFSLLF
jgi:hypothetical protein